MSKKFLGPAGTFVRALPHFVVFELIYKLLLISIGAPLLMLLLRITMKAANVNYISDEHIWVYLKNPATIAVILLFVLFVAVCSFVEMAALTACFSCFGKGRSMTVPGMFHSGLTAMKKTLRGGFSGFLRFAAFMPMIRFTLSSGVFMMPLLPLLRSACRALNISGGIAVAVYILLELLLLFVLISSCYSLHYLILTKRSFNESIRESKRVNRGKRIRHAVSVVAWGLFMAAAAAVITFVAAFIVLLFIKGFSHPRKALISSMKVLRYGADVFAAIASFLAAPAVMCKITGNFFDEISGEEIALPERFDKKSGRLKRAAVMSTLILITGMLNISYLKSIYRGNVSLNVGILSRTQITAHRGFSAAAPENTMYAFQEAVDIGADYIELDVQLSADGEVVVIHDSKVDRTTDGKGRVRDMTYSELMRLTAAYKYSGHEIYFDAKIPLLSEVLEEVGDDILLNIEIKDTGDTALTTEKTVELIKAYKLESTCYITSFSYSVLKKVKQIDPKIKTGLIANTAVTAFARSGYIDAISINYLLASPSVVNTAHQNGKRVFVWTVDSEADMKKMISLGVDNIITNRPDRAAKLVYSRNIGAWVLNLLETIFS